MNNENWEDCKYGSLGILSKEEAYWEGLVYMCKECSTLEAIGKLRKAFEAKYYSDRSQETRALDKDNQI